MNLLLKPTLYFTMLAIFIINELYSQPLSTPLKPGTRPNDELIGLVVGFGSNNQSGKLFVDCRDCIFENGTGVGFKFGLLYEKEFSENLFWGGMLTYDIMNFESTFREKELIDFVVQGTGDIEPIAVTFRHKADVNLSYFSIAPYLKWAPADFFFFRLGIPISFVGSSTIEHTQQALDKSVLLSTGDTAFVEFGKKPDNSIVVESGDIQLISSPQIALLPMFGFNFRLGSRLYFAPYFEYGLSLTDLSTKGEAFKVNSWRFMLEFRYSIAKDKYNTGKEF